MKIKSYAKVNLYLDILRKLEDGYHEIDTVFQEISLYDEITINKSHENKIIFDNVDIDEKNNTIEKTLNLLNPWLEKLQVGVEILVKKNIPMGSGLGGGSSNGAAVLKGVNKLCDLNISNEELTKLASMVGADTPFFIYGGVGRGTSKGDVIENFPSIHCPLHMVLIYPDFHSSTSKCYEKVSSFINKTKVRTQSPSALINALKENNTDNIVSNMFNLFEEIYKENEIYKEIRKLLAEKGALKTLISGSGSSIFGIFNNYNASKVAFDYINGLSNYKTFLVTSK